jgi:hypothetical protein
MLIYIACPYSRGDVALNVRAAMEAGNKILELGHTPIVAVLTHFWHIVFPKPYDEWLRIDKEMLKVCNAVLRLPGESKGADQEEALALMLNIPIYYNIEDIPKE